MPRHESVSTHAIGELRLEVLVSLYGSGGDDIDSLSIGELLEVLISFTLTGAPFTVPIELLLIWY